MSKLGSERLSNISSPWQALGAQHARPKVQHLKQGITQPLNRTRSEVKIRETSRRKFPPTQGSGPTQSPSTRKNPANVPRPFNRRCIPLSHMGTWPAKVLLQSRGTSLAGVPHVPLLPHATVDDGRCVCVCMCFSKERYPKMPKNGWCPFRFPLNAN